MSGNILDTPSIVFIVSLVAQLIAAYVGGLLRLRGRPVREDERDDVDNVQTAILTLLALIIGFTFSMAVTRYDQRKNQEEAEANAIGTEYVRADLSPVDNGAAVHELLMTYLDRRISFYEIRDQRQIGLIEIETIKLQADLWAAVRPVANMQPTPVLALIVSGMNDVLNSHGFTRAAWLNRIPVEAWAMLVLIAIACNMLLAFNERRRRGPLLVILPIIVSISLFLIADIDSPRGGIIRVLPQNLILLRDSIKQQ
jgi:hypothetical protein